MTDTLGDAFQRTSARHAGRVALRTPGGRVDLTWGEYRERGRTLSAGLAALGVTRGDTVGLMLANRPEFALCDTAALHLGATPFSIYNTYAPAQVTQLFATAGNRVVICERQFAPSVLAARPGTAVEHVVCVDRGPEGTVALADVEAALGGGVDLEAAWRAVEPG